MRDDWTGYVETTIGVELEKADEVDAMGKMEVWSRMRENSDEDSSWNNVVPTKCVLANAAKSETAQFAPTPFVEALRGWV